MDEEAIVVERVKRALKKAASDVRGMPMVLPEKFRIFEALTYAQLRLGSEMPRPEDMYTATLLIFSNEKNKEQCMAVLDANPPLKMMYQFASIRWVFIQAVFVSAGVDCPLELRCFHKAYQEELQILS